MPMLDFQILLEVRSVGSVIAEYRKAKSASETPSAAGGPSTDITQAEANAAETVILEEAKAVLQGLIDARVP